MTVNIPPAIIEAVKFCENLGVKRDKSFDNLFLVPLDLDHTVCHECQNIIMAYEKLVKAKEKEEMANKVKDKQSVINAALTALGWRR